MIEPKAVLQEVRITNGRVISLGLIMHEAIVELIIGGHQEAHMADLMNTRWYL